MTHYQKHIGRLLVRLDHVRTKYVRHRNFLIVISFIVGALSALAAVLLKVSVQFVEEKANSVNNVMGSNWLTAIFPLIGVGLSLVVLNKVFRGKLTRGVSFVIDSIFTKKSKIAKKHVWGHMFTSALTVAFGGSVGLEAPIVATGSAIGANTGNDLRLSYRDTTLLLACGAASGIAAIFDSPIAGIIFALEVLMIDFNIPFVIPLLISTATATVISQVLYPDKFFVLEVQSWNIHSIPFYILLGSLCGLASVYTTNVVEKLEGYFFKRKQNWKTWLLGSIPLCIIIFIVPGLYGEGYHTITELLSGNNSVVTEHSFATYFPNKHVGVILMCVLLLAFKPVCAALTTGAGGNGGIFAPSLMIGGLVGFLFAYVVNLTGLFGELSTSNFIVAAMAGVLAGVMHSPLTAIFLLAEITGGYKLFIPFMIVTAISYFITRKYVRHSLYHKVLVEKHIMEEDKQSEDSI